MYSVTLSSLKRTLTFIAALGVEPGDSPELRLRKAIHSVTVLVYGLIFIAVIGPFYFHFHEPAAGALYAGFGVISLIGLVWFGLQPEIFPAFLFLVMALALVAEFAGTLLLGGFMNSSGLPMWGLLTVLGALIHYGPGVSLYWFLAYLGNLGIIASFHPYIRLENHLPHFMVQILFIINFTLISGFAFLSLQQFVTQRDQAFSLLHEERQKSEKLLLNILPREIAGILKTGRNTIADHYDEASILFADVVNFTPLSEKLTPAQLVDLLNEIFSHFDGLVDKHGLEKIKTIGDCYMVAAGVPIPRTDHAHALALLALEMREYMRHHTFAGYTLLFRTGINSGPVVAGVIGHKKFIYDLWGDAVNTASRMESHGSAGAIQITGATHRLIKDDFICEPRGKMFIKGKGEMDVWHVIGEHVVGHRIT